MYPQRSESAPAIYPHVPPDRNGSEQTAEDDIYVFLKGFMEVLGRR